MTKQKFTVKCVNNGKAFEMPSWTNEKHEAALAKLGKDQEKNKWDDKTANNEFKFYVIHETLQEIDPNCTLEDVKNFCKHPATSLALFNEVYNAGKENIYYVESSFRKGKTRKDKK